MFCFVDRRSPLRRDHGGQHGAVQHDDERLREESAVAMVGVAWRKAWEVEGAWGIDLKTCFFFFLRGVMFKNYLIGASALVLSYLFMSFLYFWKANLRRRIEKI